MSGKSLKLEVINNITSKIKYLFRKKILNLALRRVLCSALTQPRFDDLCSALYRNLTQILKKADSKPQKIHHNLSKTKPAKPITHKQFWKLNRQSLNSIFDKFIMNTTFKYVS